MNKQINDKLGNRKKEKWGRAVTEQAVQHTCICLSSCKAPREIRNHHPLKQVAPQRNLSINLQPINLGFDSIYLLINQDHVCKGAKTETLCDSSEGHNCSLGWLSYPLSAKRARGNGVHHLLQFLAHYSHWKEGNSPSAEGAEHVPLQDEGETIWGLKP